MGTGGQQVGSGGSIMASGGVGTGGFASGSGGFWSGTGAAPDGSGGTHFGGRFGNGGDWSGSGGLASGGTTGGGGAALGGTSGSGGASGDPTCAQAVYDPANPPTSLSLSGSLAVSDPAIIQAGSRFYLFHSGTGVRVSTSSDLTTWQAVGSVFATNPSWIAQQVPGAADLWGPDISNFGGSYHLYYGASTSGSNRSCIGHATKVALESQMPFADRGSVVCSNATASANDDWNAIDPNVAIDQAGTPWLVFGSFWSGIKLVKLTAAGARADTATMYALAGRPNDGRQIGAAYVVWRCGYYYLFMSFDLCCNGVDATYRLTVARSTSITGPYLDKAGTPTVDGGGSTVLQGGSRWKGPGSNAVLFRDGKAYNVYYANDGSGNGLGTLRIANLVWDAQGWPISGGP